MKPAFLAVAGLALLAGCTAQAGQAAAPVTAADGQDRPSITAQGVGEVKGTPDTLTVVLGVQTRSAGAKDALDANNSKAKALIEVLKGRGVADKDIQTSQLSIAPTYDDKGQRITGYQVDNQVRATLHDLAGAGGLIDASAAAVGDAVRVASIGFSIDDDSDLKAQARSEAVRRAHDQAEQMAKAAGVKLGRVRSITESPASSPPPYPYALGAAAPARDSAVPIQPGSQELTLTVDVVYDIDQ
jgi:uncharacterized protein